MKWRAATVCVLGLIGFGGPAAQATDYTIYPTSLQDGTLWTGVGADGLSSGFGIWGHLASEPDCFQPVKR